MTMQLRMEREWPTDEVGPASGERGAFPDSESDLEACGDRG